MLNELEQLGLEKLESDLEFVQQKILETFKPNELQAIEQLFGLKYRLQEQIKEVKSQS